MSDPCRAFFEAVVEPAVSEYLEAERELSAAVMAGDEARLEAARATALRRARTAAVELHQFSDRVLAGAPGWAPVGRVRELRAWLRDHHSRRTDSGPAEDVDLLHDVADAFKHAKLTQARPGREWFVQNDKVIVSSRTGYGELGYGEGKYGGIEAIIIEKADGKKRAMSLVVKTVQGAWRSAMGFPPGAE